MAAPTATEMREPHSAAPAPAKKPQLGANLQRVAQRNATRRAWLGLLKYAIIAAAGAWYVWFGWQRVQVASDEPAARFATATVDDYAVPVFAACVWVDNDKDAKLEVRLLEVDGTTICEVASAMDGMHEDAADCAGFSKDIADYDSTRAEWQELRRVDEEQQCVYVVPRQDARLKVADESSLGSGLEVQVIVSNLEQIKEVDTGLSEWISGVSLPLFMTQQTMDPITYWTMHPDELAGEQAGPGFAGQVYEAAPLTTNSLTVTLNTVKEVDGSSGSTYAATLTSAPLTDVFQRYGAEQSAVGTKFTVLPRKLNKKFREEQTEFYSSFELADLLAGLGGIVSGVAGVVVFVYTLLVSGCALGPKVICRGWAPIPGQRPGQLQLDVEEMAGMV